MINNASLSPLFAFLIFNVDGRRPFLDDAPFASQRLEVRHPGLFKAVVKPGEGCATVRFTTASSAIEVKKYICWYCQASDFGKKEKEQVLSSLNPYLEINGLTNGVEYCFDFGIKTKGGGLHRPDTGVLHVVPGIIPQLPPEESVEYTDVSESPVSYEIAYDKESQALNERWRMSGQQQQNYGMTNGVSVPQSPGYPITGLRTIHEEEKMDHSEIMGVAVGDIPVSIATSSSNSFLSTASVSTVSTSSGKISRGLSYAFLVQLDVALM